MTTNRTCKSLCLLALAGSLVLPALPLSVRAAAPSSSLDVARQLNNAFIELAEKVSPSVVVIRVAQKPNFDGMDEEGNPFFDFIPRQFRKQLEEEMQKERKQRPKREPELNGQGSGVIIREDGYILTNRHVVDGAEKIRVRFKDGREYDAEVRGVDAQSDVAVIKIKDKSVKGLPVAKLADSNKTRVGEFAIAIGAPFSLDYSVTFGHVSAKGRSAVITGPGSSNFSDQDFIQTDASINPGNSGGPLVNIDGEVIGINTLIRGMNRGIGFAVPSNLAKEVSDKLITDGKFTRARMGIRIIGLQEDPKYAAAVKGVKDGVFVRQIELDSPAGKSDLRPADVITAVDGRPVATAQQLKNEVRSKKIGAPITLDVVREGKPLKVRVEPEEWDRTVTASNKTTIPAESDVKDLGLTVKPLTKELAKEYNLNLAEGILVTAVEPESPADREDFKPGDVITSINHKNVTSLNQYRDALKGANLKKGIMVNTLSRGSLRTQILKADGE